MLSIADIQLLFCRHGSQQYSGEVRRLQGVLQLVTGPHRIEGGWWHRAGEGADQHTLNVQRDYWVAFSEHAGVLWIYQERLAKDETAWYLQGTFS